MRLNKKSLRISYATALHGEEEEKRVLKVLKEKRTIIGLETQEFETRTAKNYGKKYGVMVNSGSSANLIATDLLRLPPGSEVITPVLTFSTTVAPLVQLGLIPVFVDVDPGTYVVNVDQVEKAISKKTKALFIPLLLGNVPNMISLRSLAKKHKLYFVEDSCDTYGATYAGKPSGAYSDISTTSFYGSHIITAGGGGGMLLVNKTEWYDRARMLRGWGRSSSLFNDSEDISKRFKAKIGGIKYDAKFIFSEIGYNMLPMELGSAFGNAQLDKLPKFKKTREHNFQELFSFFKKYEEYFVLPVQDEKVETQWLAFPLTLRKGTPFTRIQLASYLEESNIQTRPIFTGVILKQPGFSNIEHRSLSKHYPAAMEIMERSLLIGCHQGLEEIHLNKMKEVFTAFLQGHV